MDDADGHDPLRESTLVAIDECGETLSRLCTDLLRGKETRAGIRGALTELTGLLERLEQLDVSR
jgi:hypothetical protein